MDWPPVGTCRHWLKRSIPRHTGGKFSEPISSRAMLLQKHSWYPGLILEARMQLAFEGHHMRVAYPSPISVVRPA